MLGRFLEISLYTPDIQDSLGFYESLGFVQAQVGETWPYAYAVITDGHLFLGLHGSPIPSPALTFVHPNLLHGLAELEQLGLRPQSQFFGEDVFNRASFTDPQGTYINVLEARTFSPPLIEATLATACGYFSEFGTPTRDAHSAREFWERIGFVALEEEQVPFPRTTLTSDRLNLAFYRSRAFRNPVLTFEESDMAERLSRLRARNFKLSDEMPDVLDERENGVLVAPEGTRLLLMQSQS
jgi:catechol 2,3-dioxygenase-like lactoylglutathione lyase family enzyme